jgi:hypothetical protein
MPMRPYTQTGTVTSGPNQVPTDRFPPITQDPLFTGWSKPIPFWWFIGSSNYPTLGVLGQPQTNRFSHLHVVTSTDTITLGSITTTRVLRAKRSTTDTLVHSDSATRHLSAARTAVTSFSFSDSASAVKIHLPKSGVLPEPMVYPQRGVQEPPIQH